MELIIIFYIRFWKAAWNHFLRLVAPFVKECKIKDVLVKDEIYISCIMWYLYTEAARKNHFFKNNTCKNSNCFLFYSFHHPKCKVGISLYCTRCHIQLLYIYLDTCGCLISIHSHFFRAWRTVKISSNALLGFSV